MSFSPLRIGVVGGTGYTGVELLRLLSQHPHLHLHCITSRTEAGLPVGQVFPNLRHYCALNFSHPDTPLLQECDLVFFATPNGIAMQQAPALLANQIKVIDLAADFRIRNVQEWEKWYGMTHTCPEWVAQAVYGLPEIHRTSIQKAQLIANPGCYPTAVQLGFFPLLSHQLIETRNLIADVKSGVSGAGRKSETHILFSEAGDNFKAYAVAGHRHLPEIQQGLQEVAKEPVNLTFVPHLVPMIRGIHATLYATLKQDVDNETLQAQFEAYYANEPFVDVMPFGSHPETRSVRASNLCRIALHRPQGGQQLVILVVEDNLVKGAAGQAIHNMNLMFGFPETTGLSALPILP